ncbi:MAG: glyoxalase [Flavobacteriales bacterium]|nr:glyoxalase [Flavobacteriales bacterium]
MRSERDDRLVKLRPELPLENSSDHLIESMGAFQNEVLRPILKFQNSIILAQFKQYITKFKPAFNAYNGQVQRNYIQDVLKSDPRIKNSLIASVVSVMTIEEYGIYCDNKNECNKRIITLMTKRVQDQLEQLY